MELRNYKHLTKTDINLARSVLALSPCRSEVRCKNGAFCASTDGFPYLL